MNDFLGPSFDEYKDWKPNIPDTGEQTPQAESSQEQSEDTPKISGSIDVEKMNDPMIRNTELDYLFMGEGANKIVLPGNESEGIVYYGGKLESKEIPNAKVDVSDYFNPKVVKRGPVYAIVEGRRVVAYATSPTKAISYIESLYKNQGEAA